MKKISSSIISVLFLLSACLIFQSDQALAAADKANDIIVAAMYGNEADVQKALSLPDDKYKWKTYGDKTIDSRDVAVYYALVCGKAKNAEILLKHGARWSYKVLGDMPYVQDECPKKNLTSESVRKAIFDVKKDWAEGDTDGDCSRSEHMYDVAGTPDTLAVLLRNDKELCRYKGACGEKIADVIGQKDDPKGFSAIYRTYCK
ncbi:MAG: hypothetical protein J5838_06705 [Desulfovibrio sp.]|nr:hypothetical protein [Desulfovibrio sp.]